MAYFNIFKLETLGKRAGQLDLCFWVPAAILKWVPRFFGVLDKAVFFG